MGKRSPIRQTSRACHDDDCLSYIFIVSKYKDYTFDYDDMAGYLHYIQLQFSIGPSEGSWRSKETYFQNQRTLIHRIFSVKTKLSDPFPKEWYLYFHSLCSICHKKLCIFLPKKKKNWDEGYDMMGHSLGKYTGTILHKKL